MRRFLPSLTFAFHVAVCCLLAAGAARVFGQEGVEGVGDRLIKQLVFIEEHLAETGLIDGLESPYDVEVSPDGAHVYVASQRNDAISFFARDEVEGSLSYLGFVDQLDAGEDALNGARSLALSPDGKFVYAVSMFSDSLAGFRRDEVTGDLSFVDALYDVDNGIDGLNGARSVVISPDGKNLYVAAYEDSMVSVFSRNATTGVASFLGVYEEGDQGVEELTEPHALAMSPDGKHLYVALWKNEVVVFNRDIATGLLSYASKVSYLDAENAGSPGTTRSLLVSPDGKHVYLGSWNTDSLTVFSRNATTGALTHVSDVKNNSAGVTRMDGPHAVSISSDGGYVYVASFSSDSVTSFERDAETGAVSFFQDIAAEAEDSWEMNGPLSLAVSPDGEHVYVGSGSGTHSLVTFKRKFLVDPPEYVVQPVSRSIEEGQSVAFHTLAQGVDVSYQWFKDGVPLDGKVLPVLTIELVTTDLNGVVYSAVVSNGGGEIHSDEATLTVLPPVVVDAPLDLTALDISSSTANLVWTDESDNETSFEIQRRVAGAEFQTIATLLADQTQYQDTGLNSATVYRYRVRAKRNEVVSFWSNDAVIESYNDTPQAPANLTLLEQKYNRVRIKWSDRSAVEEGFRIWRRIDEVDALWEEVGQADKNATQYLDRSVSTDSTYAYRVQAYNESGGSEYSNSIVAITSANPVDSIIPVSRQVPKDAVSGYAISVNSTEDWEAVSDSSWIVVTSPSLGLGVGNQGVSYRVSVNNSQSPRSGKIVVGGIEHLVTQDGSPPFLRVNPSRIEVSAAGGTKSFQVEANQDWTAVETADWLTISSGGNGNSNGTVVLQIAANEGEASRSTNVQVGTKIVEIEQAAVAAFINATVEPSSFGSDGGSGLVELTGNAAWSVSVSEDWITFEDSVSGSGSGSVAFSVLPNDSVSQRSADIQVNGEAYTIVQSGAEPYLTVRAERTSLSAEAGEVSVMIASNTAWTASSGTAWMEITSEFEGVGSGSLTLSYEANPGTEPRSVDLYVNDMALSFAQSGMEAYLTLSVEGGSQGSTGGSGALTIDTNIAWEASVSVDWIQIDDEMTGEGGAVLGFEVAANEGLATRSGDILVNGEAVAILQESAAPFIDASASRTHFTASSATGVLSVSSNTDWEASVSEDWISFSGDSSGSGNGNVNYTVAKNEALAGRSAVLRIGEQEILIEQEAAAPFVQLGTETAYFNAVPGSGRIQVTSNTNWSASVSNPWVLFESKSSGYGNGEIQFRVSSNPSTNARSTTVKVNNATLIIRQAGRSLVPSDVVPPTFVSGEAGPLGVTLVWNDRSDDEIGFIVSRALRGVGSYLEIAVLPAGTQTFLDRKAKRGFDYTYRVSSYDSVGRSEAASLDVDGLPVSRMVAAAARAEMGASGEMALADIPMGGTGEVSVQVMGFGDKLEGRSFGLPFGRTLYSLHDVSKGRKVIGEGNAINETERFGLDGLAPRLFAADAKGLSYAAAVSEETDALLGGVSVIGEIRGGESVLAVGFEIKGEAELPVLLRGSGASLAAKRMKSVLSDPVIRLYRATGDASWEMVLETDSWKDGSGLEGLTLEEAVLAEKGLPLDEAGAEAGTIALLEEGRYVALLSGVDGATGMAKLEAVDLR